MKDLATTVANWRNSTAGGQQAFSDGVQRTQVDPTQRAIDNSQALLANFTESVTSGRWARNLAAVGIQGWKTATIAKAGNWATGVAAGEGKFQSAMQVWLPRIDSAASAAKAMPGATLQQRLARANAFATALYNAKRGI